MSERLTDDPAPVRRIEASDKLNIDLYEGEIVYGFATVQDTAVVTTNDYAGLGDSRAVTLMVRRAAQAVARAERLRIERLTRGKIRCLGADGGSLPGPLPCIGGPDPASS